MRICSRVSASSAPNGSSISSSGGSWISARTIAARWRMPPESSRGRRSWNSPRPTLREQRRARASTYAFGSRPRSSSCSSTLSSDVAPFEQHRALEHDAEIRSARRSTSLPSSCTLPPVWRSSPAMMRSSVLLPQPDGPTIATNSPSRDVRSIGRARASSFRRRAENLADAPDLDIGRAPTRRLRVRHEARDARSTYFGRNSLVWNAVQGLSVATSRYCLSSAMVWSQSFWSPQPVRPLEFGEFEQLDVDLELIELRLRG